MRTKLALGRFIVGGVTAALFTFACSDDNKGSGESTEGGAGDSGVVPSGGKTGTGGATNGGKSNGGTSGGSGGSGGSTTTGGSSHSEAGVPDSGDGGGAVMSLCGGLTGDKLVACGEYMVTAVDACGDCHTPRTQTGPDTTKILAGSPSFADIDPTDDTIGNIPAPNLTMLKKDKWTEAEIMDAIQNGKVSAAHGGKGLFPAMPYFVFHNMATIDAQAIADYLLSLTAITNDVGTRQPLGIPDAAFPVPATKFSDLPDPVIAKTDPAYADAQLGKYLAAEAGVCVECHTKHESNGTLDMTRAFGGGESFAIPGLGNVISANITPDKNTGLGTGTWTPGLVKTLLKTGKNDNGDSICPPMPVGPMGAFGNLTDPHALAIGTYITHLPAVSAANDGGGRFPFCILPGAPPATTDAGGDASSKDSGKD
jgi:mono/diheme cytochrome c family protein